MPAATGPHLLGRISSLCLTRNKSAAGTRVGASKALTLSLLFLLAPFIKYDRCKNKEQNGVSWLYRGNYSGPQATGKG